MCNFPWLVCCQVLLEQDIFHCSLMACCLEVVLFSYSSQRTFPWIINIFKLAPFYFFKVTHRPVIKASSSRGHLTTNVLIETFKS